MSAIAIFRIYRYQLLPIDRHTQDLYDGRTTDELIQQKNAIFAKAIPFIRNYRHRGSELSVRIADAGTEAFVLGVASRRALQRETPDFRAEQIENWPHVTAIILNRHDEQFVAVQDRSAAFASTDTVIKMIQGATRVPLARAGLRMHVERMFHQNYFWELVQEHRSKIIWVEFDFVTPNMANISRELSDTLKRLAKDTNASESNLQLRSDPASALDINPQDETVQGLVEYTSQGGGDISLKVRGLRKRIQASGSVREIQMDDLQLSGSPEQVASVLRGLLK